MHKTEANNIAVDIAQEVLNHIDTMYPNALKSVPQSARQSIKNTIIRQVVLNIKDLEFLDE